MFEMMNCQFVKFMGQNFSQMLAFPMNLIIDFKQLAEVITLKGPSGNRWQVRFSNIGGHINLKEGWKEFVEANHVEEGDCLVFEYCGSSCFSVLIFDRSGCEREASYFYYEKSSFNAKFDRRRFGMRSSAPNDRINCEHTIQSKKEEEHSAKHGSVNMQERQTTGIKLKAKLRYLRSTNAICAKTFYFTKFLLPSHLSGTSVFMIFPFDFAAKHFHLRPQKIILRHQDKMWSVKYKFKVASNGDSVTGLYGKGWRMFVEDNKLCEGNGCIFVLSESGKEKVLDVHIVRADDQADMV